MNMENKKTWKMVNKVDHDIKGNLTALFPHVWYQLIQFNTITLYY